MASLQAHLSRGAAPTLFSIFMGEKYKDNATTVVVVALGWQEAGTGGATEPLQLPMPRPAL